MPTPVNHKLQRNKAKQYLYRCIPTAQRTPAITQAIQQGNLPLLVAWGCITKQQAKHIAKMGKVNQTPKLPPTKIKLGKRQKVQLQANHVQWQIGTNSYHNVPLTITGYLMHINPQQGIATVYKPARGNTPAVTFTASLTNTGMHQYYVSKWL